MSVINSVRLTLLGTDSSEDWCSCLVFGLEWVGGYLLFTLVVLVVVLVGACDVLAMFL